MLPLPDLEDLPRAREPKTLIWDTEVGPQLVWAFGVWDVNINRYAIKEGSRVYCASWAWDDDDAVYFVHEGEAGHRAMVERLWSVLNQADQVVSYNGVRFDTRRIGNEFSKYKMAPPSPFKEIDLFRAGKRRFDLPFKGLDDLAAHLGVSRKGHIGKYFETWERYLAGDPAALGEIRQYSIQDTVVTKEVFQEMKPWL